MSLDATKAEHIRAALESQLSILERMSPEERVRQPSRDFAAYYDKLRDSAQEAMREVAAYRWPPKASFTAFGGQQAVSCVYIELTAYMKQLTSIITDELDAPGRPG